MRSLAALVLVTGVVLWSRRLGAAQPDAPTAALAVGFTIIAALIAGDLLRRFRLPRVSGYLLFGVLVGPHLGNIITEPMARQLQVVNGLATVLIAFIAGLALNFERIGRRIPGVTRLLAGILAVAISSMFLATWLAWPWLPIDPTASGGAKIAMILVVAIVCVSFSPTMTAAVISETGARGRLSELVLVVVVLADLAVLVLFTAAMQSARAVFDQETVDGVNAITSLAWELGGAMSFGSLVGALFALYLRYVARETTLVLLAVCALLSQVGTSQRFEPLVAAVAAGMVIGNAAVAQGDALKVAIQRGALPVLVVFFVTIGASLRLDVLAAVGFVPIALAVVRLLVLRGAAAAGLRASGIDWWAGQYLWTGLISQAGITLGLAAVLAGEFPTWGARVQLLLAALIVVDELIGPALFRSGLSSAGELDTSQAARPLLVVSNREPYLHSYDAAGHVQWAAAPGGVAVALDALMRERDGVWIACGDGPADRELVDARDKLRVPPDAPAYHLRRLWIERETYAAYYGGFANEGLWPLCHLVDVRPQFRPEDWLAYRAVNDRFAAAIDEELPTSDTPVFIQDYHLALVAERLRMRRPSARLALFWHIPWPYPDRLRICPWRREILEGLLANDLLAFQLERDRRNFVQAVEEELEAEVEADGARILWQGRVTTATAAPIGVDYDRIQEVAAAASVQDEQQRLMREFGLGNGLIGLGVDRLDYTKGIPERLDALDRLFTTRPDLRGRLTFVQIGVPSRSDLQSYGAIEQEIDRKVAELNVRHGLAGAAQPVHYHKGALNLPSLVALYRLADFCIVSSLHDGMNLVAKEFVAARDDEDGVLVLSALAGAAQELGDALIINPYDVEGFAAALGRALDMPRAERQTRMRALRRAVAGRNVFGWASDILEGLESLWTKPLAYASRAPQDAPV